MRRVEIVCTGNICRSPTAQHIAAARLPADRFRVHSAGTYGLHGYPIEPKAGTLLANEGFACDAFRARRLDPAMVAAAHLILTATREHRTAVVTMVPNALPKTFTIREFARLTEHVPPVEAEDLVAAAAAQRGRVWVPPEHDDIADPYGQNAVAYERAYREIYEALARPLALLAGTTVDT